MADRLVCQTQVPGSAASVAFSADGAAVAVTSDVFVGGVSSEAVVQVSDARTGAVRFQTRFAGLGLSDRVVFSPDGRLVAASGAHSLVVLDAVTGAVKWNREFDLFVLEPSFSPDGTLLLSGFSAAVSLFRAETGVLLSEFAQVELREVAFHPDGNTFAKACQDEAGAGLVIVADTANGLTRFSRTLQERLRTIAYSGDGATIAFGGFSGLAGLIDSGTGVVRGLFAHTPGAPDVFHIECSPDSRLVATLDTNFTTRVYDANTFALRHTIDNVGELTTAHTLQFSPDSKSLLLAKGRHHVRAIDMTTGAELYAVQHNTPDPMGPTIQAAALSRDGKRLVIASGGDGVVKVFDPFTADTVELTHDGPVRALAFAPDGLAVATGAADSTARVFVAATGDERARLNHDGPVRSVAWVPTGSLVVTGSEDGSVRVFDSAKATERFRLTHRGPVLAVAARADGRKVVSGGEDGRARLIDVEAAAQQVGFSHDGPVVAVAFSGDRKLLGTASADGTARLFNSDTGGEQLRLSFDGPVRALAFSPDGQLFAAGADDRTARVFSIESGAELCRVAHGGAVLSLAFHPNSAVVVTGSADGVARTFAVPSGQPMATRSHAGPVRMVAFSVSGLAATAGDDKTARVFVADSGVEKVRHDHPKPVVAVAFSPDGRRLVTACEDGTARIFEI
jgi:WD40 repeat protein